MAIEFDGTDDLIDFGTPAAVVDLAVKTIVVRFKISGYGENNQGAAVCFREGTSTTGWDLRITDFTPGAKVAAFLQIFSGTDGRWITPDNSILVDTEYTVGVSYNRGATTNDPTMYINGASVSVTEAATPTGSVDSDAAATLRLGNNTTNDREFEGVLREARIYNRILTAQEHADIAALKRVDDGVALDALVFHCDLLGAALLQTFDGSTLGATNVIKDRIAGLTGTPSGNPVGRADTVIGYGG